MEKTSAVCFFTRDENMPGYYDLKINFQKNLFEVWSYRLFARCPIVWHIDDTENISMSYHHGAGERPIMIHLKNEMMRGADAYRTLPVKNILAPGTDSMFPLPLCKLEIPDNVVNQAEVSCKRISSCGGYCKEKPQKRKV